MFSKSQKVDRNLLVRSSKNILQESMTYKEG